MRSSRVFFLLLSLLQFIFFLKLIEYVRGEEIPEFNNGASSSEISQYQLPVSVSTDNGYLSASNLTEEPRGKFIAPKIKRKKLKPWIIGKTDAKENATKGVATSNFIQSQNTLSSSHNNSMDLQQGRGCPACENNECIAVKPIGAGFPIVPFVIAVITGVAWFILFLIFWLFWQPNKHGGGVAGGYGVGYDSAKPQYGPPQDDDEKGSIFDHFLKPHERSLESYTRILSTALDSIGKLTDLYKSY